MNEKRQERQSALERLDAWALQLFRKRPLLFWLLGIGSGLALAGLSWLLGIFAGRLGR